MEAAIVWDVAYAEHDTGGHIEGPDRAEAVVRHLEQTDLWDRLALLAPSPATAEDLLRVHTAAHVERVRRVAESGGDWLDPDTFVSPRSYEIALLAAGGALDISRHWDEGLVSFALVRPPGHHALPDRAMGFCLFNNIAVAARALVEQGTERVAIIDWDIHHGNGTQAAFWDEPRVLFVSLHMWPFYPGSGWYDEVGEGAGKGFTVNLPLPAGSTDGDYACAFTELVEPVVRRFAPQAILVSAGEDIHVRDPLGCMSVTEAGFAQMGLRVSRLARESAEGRLGFTLEGGYDRAATARAVEAVLRAVSDEEAPEAGGPTHEGRVSVERAVEEQRRYWEL